MKKLLVLLFITSLAHASIPVRDENGCTIGSTGAENGAGPEIAGELKALDIKEDRVAIVPFYLHLGVTTTRTFVTHPYDRPDFNCPPITHRKTEILLPITNKLVGHVEYAFSDVYLSVPSPEYVKYFPGKDVWVESTESWDFHEFRK